MFCPIFPDSSRGTRESSLGSYPKVFFQINQPSVEPEGEQLEAAEIFTRLADRLGLIPDVPSSLFEAAESGDRLKFGLALMEFMGANPDVAPRIPFVLAKTLGKSMGSVNLATIWAALQTLPPEAKADAERAGFTPGPLLGEEIFKTSLAHPEGLWLGEVDTKNNLKRLATEDGRINLDVPELRAWIEEIDPAKEAEALELDPAFPFVMSSGNHMDTNANSAMRDPVWNEGKRACTLYMNPRDAAGERFQGWADRTCDHRSRPGIHRARSDGGHPARVSRDAAGVRPGPPGEDVRSQCQPSSQEYPSRSFGGHPLPSPYPLPCRGGELR